MVVFFSLIVPGSDSLQTSSTLILKLLMWFHLERCSKFVPHMPESPKLSAPSHFPLRVLNWPNGLPRTKLLLFISFQSKVYWGESLKLSWHWSSAALHVKASVIRRSVVLSLRAGWQIRESSGKKVVLMETGTRFWIQEMKLCCTNFTDISFFLEFFFIFLFQTFNWRQKSKNCG